MTTAGVRVRLLAGVLWAVVALGPVLGGLALVRSVPSTPVAVDPPAPAGVVAIAELAVLAHLGAAPGDVAPAPLSPGLSALRLTTSAGEGLTGEQRVRAAAAADAAPIAVAAVGAVPAGTDRWGVTVAVLRDGALEGWQVTVALSPTGPVIESLPALVGLPAGVAQAVPDLPGLRAPDADDPLDAAVDGFLAALLLGEGDLQRYVATGADILRPSGAVAEVELRRITARPVRDQQVAALAEARVVRSDGAVHLLHYPLLLQPRSGRWEVTRLLPALPVRPAVAATAPPAPSTPSGPPPTGSTPR